MVVLEFSSELLPLSVLKLLAGALSSTSVDLAEQYWQGASEPVSYVSPLVL
jgi:hypothetical protein